MEDSEIKKVQLINREKLRLKLGGLSDRSISRYIRLCKIPKPVRIGHKLLWNEEVVNRWIEAGCPADWDGDSEKEI